MKTQTLDEAVFLTVKGLRHTKVRALGQIHSEWTFEDSTKQKTLSNQFWSGAPTVSLNKWLMIRMQLKIELKNKLSQQKPKCIPLKDSEGMLHPKGTEYWYINEQESIMHCTYGKAKSHNKRVKEGNFYLNRIQAVEAQKNKS